MMFSRFSFSAYDFRAVPDATPVNPGIVMTGGDTSGVLRSNRSLTGSWNAVVSLELELIGYAGYLGDFSLPGTWRISEGLGEYIRRTRLQTTVVPDDAQRMQNQVVTVE